MKTFLVHKVNSSAPERREIRAPIERELNVRPDQIHTSFDMPNTFRPMQRMDEYDPLSTFTITREVFETCRFVTMVWVEVDTDGHVSNGYYNRFASYFQIPHDVELGELAQNLIPDYEDIYHRLGTVPERMSDEMFYRHRIRQLEDRLRDVEENRMIVPQEELDAIHNGARDCHDKPIPVQYFDENIFEVE